MFTLNGRQIDAIFIDRPWPCGSISVIKEIDALWWLRDALLAENGQLMGTREYKLKTSTILYY